MKQRDNLFKLATLCGKLDEQVFNLLGTRTFHIAATSLKITLKHCLPNNPDNNGLNRHDTQKMFCMLPLQVSL